MLARYMQFWFGDSRTGAQTKSFIVCRARTLEQVQINTLHYSLFKLETETESEMAGGDVYIDILCRDSRSPLICVLVDEVGKYGFVVGGKRGLVLRRELA